MIILLHMSFFLKPSILKCTNPHSYTPEHPKLQPSEFRHHILVRKDGWFKIEESYFVQFEKLVKIVNQWWLGIKSLKLKQMQERYDAAYYKQYDAEKKLRPDHNYNIREGASFAGDGIFLFFKALINIFFDTTEGDDDKVYKVNFVLDEKKAWTTIFNKMEQMGDTVDSENVSNAKKVRVALGLFVQVHGHFQPYRNPNVLKKYNYRIVALDNRMQNTLSKQQKHLYIEFCEKVKKSLQEFDSVTGMYDIFPNFNEDSKVGEWLYHVRTQDKVWLLPEGLDNEDSDDQKAAEVKEDTHDEDDDSDEDEDTDGKDHYSEDDYTSDDEDEDSDEQTQVEETKKTEDEDTLEKEEEEEEEEEMQHPRSFIRGKNVAKLVDAIETKPSAALDHRQTPIKPQPPKKKKKKSTE